MFGSTSQTSSLFGTPAKPAATTTTSLFGTPQQPQQQQQQQQPLQSTGLFGNNTNVTGANSLFGTTATSSSSSSTQQGSTPAFSFGSSTTTPNLFGGSGTTNQNATTSGTGLGPSLFGSANTAPLAQPTTSLFGSSTTKPAGAAPSLFGNTTAAAPAPNTNLFGSTAGGTAAANPAGGLFGTGAPTTGGLGTSLFGASTNQQQQQQQRQQQQQQQLQLQSQQQQVQLTSLTRHSDLPEPAQKELDEVDKYITQQIEISEDLSARKETRQELLQSVPRDVEVILRKLTTTNHALANDVASMTLLKSVVDVSTEDVQLCLQLIQQLRIPGARLPPGDPLLAYFERLAIELQAKIDDYKTVLQEVDGAVDGIEREIIDGRASTGAGAEAVLQALREEYAVFMSLGNKVAEVHHSVARLERRDK
ncbi:hypothetical protein V1514DRAFT_325068 [Lipomyces japonicus]|uniref:uncharacterized protein n=1 Tax=Lipomyces japonicus TaxID=56871 RepID=UPI0034CFEB5D